MRVAASEYGSLSAVRALLADGAARRFELVSAATAATGVRVCRYRPVRG